MKLKYTLLLLISLFFIAEKVYSQNCTYTPTNIKITEVKTGIQKGIAVSWDPDIQNLNCMKYQIILEFTITTPHTFDTIDAGLSPSRLIPYTDLCNGTYNIYVQAECCGGAGYGPISAPVSWTVLSEEACYISTTLCPGVTIDANDVDVFSGLKKVIIPCDQETYTIKPEIKVVGQGIVGYEVEAIPYSPPYPLTEGDDIPLDKDDAYSGITYLPFKFCFYDSVYDKLLMAPNGYVTFNTQYANQQCGFSLTGYGPLPQPTFGQRSGTDWRNAVYGVFEDINPNTAVSTGTGSFKYGIRGDAPCRVFINSYFDIPLYSHTTLRQSYQIVLYEGTNVIDVYVAKRNYPPSWNGGLGVIGVQNADGTKATCPPGRNLGDKWSTFDNRGKNVPEAWRFTPINESKTYKVTWSDGEGNYLGEGDSLTVSCKEFARKTVIATLEVEACNGKKSVYRDTTIFSYDKPEIVDSVEICQMESYQENGWNIPMQKRTGEFEFFRTRSGTFDNYCGCDTVWTLALTVKPRPNTDTTTTACPQDTVWLNNKFSYNKEEYLVDTMTAMSGCDSIIVMRVNRHPTTAAGLEGTPAMICADDSSFIMKLGKINSKDLTPSRYQIVFDEKALAAGFENVDTVPFDSTTYEIEIKLPDKVYPDTYCANISFVDTVNQCPGTAFEYCFDVYYPDTIMSQKWNDVIAVKNKFYNGGFEMSGWQWYTYENGFWIPIQGETKSILQNNVRVGKQYLVEITRPDGSKMKSCPITIKDGKPTNPWIIVLGDRISIILEKGKSKVNVWTSNGILVNTSTHTEPSYTIPMPSNEGTYIIEVIGDETGRSVKPLVVSKN